MADRMTRMEVWAYFALALTNAAAAVKGQVACIDTATGLLNVAGAETTLEPIGYFDETVTGDGVTLVRVRLFRDVTIHWLDNDTAPNNVAAANIGSNVYLKDGHTVSTSSATGTRSIAGRVWGVSATNGVAVAMAIPA